MATDKDIKYTGREFEDYKHQLVEFVKNYYPDTYNDFSPSSPGMMFIEMAAYVGDILSFYQDIQLQETFLQYAKNPANLYSLAYMMGYRPKVSSAAKVELKLTQVVDATGVTPSPNLDQALRLVEGTVIPSTFSQTSFILDRPVDFSTSGSYDPTTIMENEYIEGEISTYTLEKRATATAGEIKTISRTFTTAEKFTTIEIEDNNILGILDIVDGGGEKWYEVPFLGQSTILEEVFSPSGDPETKYTLQVRQVPKRFVTRFTSKEVLQVQFGAGIAPLRQSSSIPNPNLLMTGSILDVSRLDIAYDPSNFLFTDSYGLAPSNTTLTIRYIVGGGINSNIPAYGINSTGGLGASALDPKYVESLQIYNELPATGGKDGDTSEEIRQNSLRAFAEQQRVVTLQDYIIRSLSMPSRLGSIAKVYPVRDLVTNTTRDVLDRNPLAISLYIISYDGDGKFRTTSNLVKNNLKTYLSQYMMITDSIDIRDAFIVNIGISFEIVSLPNYPSQDVLLACNKRIQNWFASDRMDINQTINLSGLYTELDRVPGVQTVKKIQIENKVGGRYSNYAYDITRATRDNIVYPSYDPCIFEIKYPGEDIKGRVTTT